MEKQHKTASMLAKKRKRKMSAVGAASEPKNLKSKPDTPSNEPVPKKSKAAKEKVVEVAAPSKPEKSELKSANGTKKGSKKNKKSKVTKPEPKKPKIEIPKQPSDDEMESEPESSDDDNETATKSTSVQKSSKKGQSSDKVEKYPILKDKDLIEQFLKVQINNNQRGRIRQAIRLSLQGVSEEMLPDIIHGKLQAIIKVSKEYTIPELRRIRILYNMLQTSLKVPEKLLKPMPEKKKKDKNNKVQDGEENTKKGKKNKEQVGQEKIEKVGNDEKAKGPKRYVAFVGNLPLDITREKLMHHFEELHDNIKDVRVLPVIEGKKCAVAFIELANQTSYEMALSKHHTMIGNKCIKVQYSRQKNSKISKSKAKGKAAKLIALQKSGKLVGSIPANKKRSHRRNIMKKAKANENNE